MERGGGLQGSSGGWLVSSARCLRQGELNEGLGNEGPKVLYRVLGVDVGSFRRSRHLASADDHIFHTSICLCMLMRTQKTK